MITKTLLRLDRPANIGILNAFLVVVMFQASWGQTTYTSNCQVGGNGICNWNAQNTWLPSTPGGPGALDNVIIKSGQQINIQNQTTITNVTIEEGAILIAAAAFTVNGDLKVDGNLVCTGALNLSGLNRTIDGNGAITASSNFTLTNNKTILPTADLSVVNSGNIRISNGVTVTNQGKIGISGNVIATSNNGTPTWTNSAGSYLAIGNAFFANTINETFNASASPNTVNYFGSGPQTIVAPSGNTYHHLIISGSDDKVIQSDLIVNGNLEIISNLQSATASTIYKVNLRGNWVNSGVFKSSSVDVEGDSIINVTFDGSGLQTISSTFSVNGELFHDLSVAKSSGNLQLLNSVTVSNQFSASSGNNGNVIPGSNTLTLGTGTSNQGSLSWQGSGSIIGKFRRWINGASTGTPFLFPVGSTEGNASLSITFTNLTGGTLTAEFTSEYPGRFDLAAGLLVDGVTLYNIHTEGYWKLTPANAHSSNLFNLDLTAAWFDSFGGLNANSRILYRTNSLAAWGINGTHNGSSDWSNGNLKRSNLTQLTGNFAFGSDFNCDPPVTSSIIASEPVACKGSVITYSVTGGAGNQFNWTLQNNGGTISGNGTDQIQITWGSIGLDDVLTVVEVDPGCAAGQPQTLAVRVNALTPAITGRTNLPDIGAVETYEVIDPVPGYTYDWEITGGTPLTGTGTSIEVTWPPIKGTGEVKVTATDANCPSGDSEAILDIKIYDVIVSTGTNTNWSNRQAWDCSCVPAANDNVAVLSGHTINVGNNINPQVRNLFVLGTLNISSNILTVTEDIEVSGTLGGGGTLKLEGNNKELRGIGGNISVGTMNVTGNRMIPSTTLLTRTGPMAMTGVIITNNGIFSITGSITTSTGAAANSSKWINGPSSNLVIGGALLSNNANSQLDASAVGNTVSYVQGANNVNIKNAQYYNLEVSGTNTKRLSTAANLALRIISISHNFINNGNFIPNEGTVIFNGPASILGTSVSSFHHVIVDGTGSLTLSSETINVKGDFTFNGPLAHNGGTVNFNGVSSILGTVTPNFNTVVVAADSELTSSSGDIGLAGNFTNNGVFNHNGGTVVFNGTTASQINGTTSLTTFRNITSSNAAGVTVNAANVDLLGILNVTAGTFDADGSGSSVFSLRSLNDDFAQDAAIAPLLGGAQVSGNVRVERYMSPEARLYRYISSPVMNSTVADWMDDFPVTGRFPDRSTSAQWSPTVLCDNVPLIPNNASLFYYNEEVLGTMDLGYVAYPLTNGGIPSTASPLERGRGYAAFIRLCASPTIVDVRGPVHQGTFNLPVSFTPSDPPLPGDDGWNLVGNPYPSAIDWDATGPNGWTKQNVSNVIAIRDNGQTGPLMRYYDGISGDFNGVIATGQAFWVRATSSVATLTIREGVKAPGVEHIFYRQRANNIPSMKVSLSYDGIADNTYIRLREGVSEELDDWDGPKLKNGIFNLSTVTPRGSSMAINAIPAVYEGMRIPLRITDTEDGTYTLKIEGTEDFLQYEVELNDSYTKSTQIVKWGDAYEFSIQSSEAASAAPDRISLRLINGGGGLKEQPAYMLSVYPNPVTSELYVNLPGDQLPRMISVFNNMGVNLGDINIAPGVEKATIDFSSKASGVYLIRLVSPGYTGWAKVIRN